VRRLALHCPEGDRGRLAGSWLRHALTMAARSRLFHESDEGREVERSLLSLAHRVVIGQDCLRGGVSRESEQLLDSLCQFDALAAVAVIGDAGSDGYADYYPNFAQFHGSRTQPIIARLLVDPSLREAIFPGDDENLASALRMLNQWAHKASLRFAGWDGYSDDRILSFLTAHPAEETR
jgi:hypothetical protein